MRLATAGFTLTISLLSVSLGHAQSSSTPGTSGMDSATAGGTTTGTTSGSTSASGSLGTTGSTAAAGSPFSTPTGCSNADPLDETAAELGCPHSD